MEDDILQMLGLFGENNEESSDSDDDLGDVNVENDIMEAENNDDIDEEDIQVEVEEGNNADTTSDGGDENDNDDDNDEGGSSNITFDKSLPGTHSYLGADMEDVRGGRTVHAASADVADLPLLSVPGVVLCPGQTVPLQLFQPHLVAMMQRVVDDGAGSARRGAGGAEEGTCNTFGLVATSSQYRSGRLEQQLESIGTTAEVLSFKMEEDEGSGIRNVRVKAIGRQRFRIKETRRTIDGTILGHVSILPEYVLPDPFLGVRPCIHMRPSIAPAAVTGADGQQRRRPHRVTRLSSADLTHWPAWVYKQYDMEHLMERVRGELAAGWNLRDSGAGSGGVAGMPSGPVEMSHWLAANLPLDDVLRGRLLAVDSAVTRLRAEISIMQRCTALCCRECNVLIARKRDVFSMALEGPMAAYVNPGGFVHETLTVTRAHNLELIGRSSMENSWFPGYAWTILQCRSCSQHIGWRFTAARRSLRPQRFYGLTRSGLMPGLLTNPNGRGRGVSESSVDGGGDAESVVYGSVVEEEEEDDDEHWQPLM